MYLNDYSFRHFSYEKMIFPMNYDKFDKFVNNGKPFVIIDAFVNFQELEFGEPLKSVKKKMGTPRYIIEKPDTIAPLIFFYKKHFLNHEIITQLFFYDNKFLFATSTLFDVNADWKKLVKKMVCEKYNNEKTDKFTLDLKELYFIDPQLNKIIISDDVNLNIMYISGNSDHLKLIYNHSAKLNQRNKDEDLKSFVLKEF